MEKALLLLINLYTKKNRAVSKIISIIAIIAFVYETENDENLFFTCSINVVIFVLIPFCQNVRKICLYVNFGIKSNKYLSLVGFIFSLKYISSN